MTCYCSSEMSCFPYKGHYKQIFIFIWSGVRGCGLTVYGEQMEAKNEKKKIFVDRFSTCQLLACVHKQMFYLTLLSLVMALLYIVIISHGLVIHCYH
jgi:hypothetical protein